MTMRLSEAFEQAAMQVSTTKAAAAGGTGGSVAIAAAMLDPGTVELWLRLATLGVGLVTALGSGALVYLKLLQNWKARHKQ